MSAFAMAHPWMTLLIALVALIGIDNAITNICNTIAARDRAKAKTP